MAKIKSSQLKKELKLLNEKELIALILELYKQDSNVQEFLSLKFLSDEERNELYNKARKKIEKEFFPKRGTSKLRLKEARDVIFEFYRLTNDISKSVDLMIFFVEMGTAYTKSFGDMDEKFYNSMLSMYEKAVMECEQNEELLAQYHNRLYALVEKSINIGYGYDIELQDIYASIGYFEENHLESKSKRRKFQKF